MSQLFLHFPNTLLAVIPAKAGTQCLYRYLDPTPTRPSAPARGMTAREYWYEARGLYDKPLSLVPSYSTFCTCSRTCSIKTFISTAA